ncbi:MAG: SGNH/GDSL hydrolase family protein [Ruminococcaceae bacterium]|nr:SGNH/GDSL hydrolase family protein [Oscillospiraceae bacterium]
MKRVFSVLLILAMLLGTLIIPVSALDPQVPEVLGASIRTEGNQGLRFVGRIKKTGSITLTHGSEANFGFLIIPESSTDGSAITKDTDHVSQIPAALEMGQGSVEAAGLTYDPNYYYFCVVQINIPANFYGTNFVARAYINNGGSYIYSDSGETRAKRSIQYVAQTIAGMGGDIPAFITTVLTKCAEEGYDVYVNGNRFFPSSGSYASSTLQNTYARLTTAKKLNVAYLGGSITKGVGASDANTTSWRALTTSWLKTNFPDADITETNAGIGGTGSVFGCYRAIDDLKLENDSKKPDLLFIDFAINDQYDGITVAEVKQYMETIVRTVYEYSPYCDIVFVYTTDRTRRNYTDSSNYPTLAAQHDVATKYGLTEIYVGKQLCEAKSITSTSTWDSSNLFADIVHPNDSGHALYAGYVTSVLNTELTKSLNPYGYVAHSILSASYSPLTAPARYFFNASSGKTTGFTLYEGTNLDEKGYLKPEPGETGAQVKFTFVGTGLQLWTYARTVSSTISVNIDGSSNSYTIQRSGSDGNKPYRVASGLSNTTHTVTITVTATSSTTSSNVLDLMALMVEGDPNFTGVTFINVN